MSVSLKFTEQYPEEWSGKEKRLSFDPANVANNRSLEEIVIWLYSGLTFQKQRKWPESAGWKSLNM